MINFNAILCSLINFHHFQHRFNCTFLKSSVTSLSAYPAQRSKTLSGSCFVGLWEPAPAPCSWETQTLSSLFMLPQLVALSPFSPRCHQGELWASVTSALCLCIGVVYDWTFARCSSPSQWARVPEPSFRGNCSKAPSLCSPVAGFHKQLLISHGGQIHKIKIFFFKWAKHGWLRLSPGDPDKGQRLLTTMSVFTNPTS